VSAPDLPRFKVASTGTAVLDTWNTHREVAVFEGSFGAALAVARRRTVARCAELEAWHEQAMANDA
jgi:hypothetical protein